MLLAAPNLLFPKDSLPVKPHGVKLEAIWKFRKKFINTNTAADFCVWWSRKKSALSLHPVSCFESRKK
jgi:hypothetical protein